jgi:hypothetical protein
MWAVLVRASGDRIGKPRFIAPRCMRSCSTAQILTRRAAAPEAADVQAFCKDGMPREDSVGKDVQLGLHCGEKWGMFAPSEPGWRGSSHSSTSAR